MKNKIKKALSFTITLLTLLVLSTFLCTVCNAEEIPTDQQNKSQFDFRQTKWGMSKEEVIKSEKLDLIINQDNNLLFSTSIINKNCILFYSFKDNKLESGGYLFQVEHTNLNDYIYDYIDIKKLLVQKYNKPTIDSVNWKNNLYQDSPQDWGVAISIGHLNIQSFWENSNTKIMIGLSGDNFKINLGLIYSSKDLEDNNCPSTEGL
jgi:hypothetical protein